MFITAHAGYAVRAFDVEAVDFLVKPIQLDRFARMVRRLEKLFLSDGKKMAASQDTTISLGPLALPVAGGRRLVNASDIGAILAEGDDSRLLLYKNRALFCRRSIGSFTDLLPRPPFLRLSRSLMVNRDRIAEIRTINRDSTCLVLRNNRQELLLGRKAATLSRHSLAEIAR